MADAQVEVVAHDPVWADRFREVAARLVGQLAPWLAPAGVLHIGSTAVPGLAAKPVVDVAAVLVDLAASASAAVRVLEQDGWLHWREDPVPGRSWLLRPTPAHRTHHLHLYQQGHPSLAAVLAFRDRLRRDEDVRQRYAELKHRLAVEHHDDREAYTEAKGAFVASVLSEEGVQLPTRG